MYRGRFVNKLFKNIVLGSRINTGVHKKIKKNTRIVKNSLVKIVQNGNISMSKNILSGVAPQEPIKGGLQVYEKDN